MRGAGREERVENIKVLGERTPGCETGERVGSDGGSFSAAGQ